MNGRTAQPDPRLELRLEAKPHAVAQIRRQLAPFAARYSVDETVDLSLAVSEAVSNAVLHAYRGGETGFVRVVACVRDSELVVVVRDYGCGMKPHPGSPGAGFGLSIIGAAASEMRVERPDDGGGTRIRLRFRRDSRLAA
jgi:anti-sigma regulatory factor (Ser/Thr protein kinase)